MSDQPLQTNAADVDQVRRADAKVKSAADQAFSDLAWVLSDRRGRRWFRRELARHGLYESITRTNSLIYVLSGRRDVGLEMLGDVVAHEELYLLMEKEAREDARRAADENAAARVRARTRS